MVKKDKPGYGYHFVSKAYQALRNESYVLTTEDLKGIVSDDIDTSRISLAPINYRTIAEKTKYWDFDWLRLSERYRKMPRRFELSVWYDDELCGLALGNTSKKKSKTRIDFIEGGLNNSLTGYIFNISLTCCMNYAGLTGRESVVINNPKEKLIEYYTNHYPEYMTYHPTGLGDYKFSHIKLDLLAMEEGYSELDC